MNAEILEKNRVIIYGKEVSGMKVDKTWSIIVGIIFVLYNFLVFLIAGFGGHSIVFLTSYIMSVFSMLLVFFMILRLTAGKDAKKVLFLGYSVFVWSGVFLLLQIMVTTVFMVLDSYIRPALGIELILIAAYAVITLACFKNQEIVEEIQQTREVSTGTMKMLRTQLEVAEALCDDIDIKKTIQRLKEEFEYSDSVSSMETSALEAQMSAKIELLKNVSQTDAEQAKILCEQLGRQLKERNIVCQRSKKRY